MKNYHYKALSRNGTSLSGTIDADSEQTAMQALVRRGIYPLTVEATGALFISRRQKRGGGLFGPGTVAQGDVTDATRELCTFLQAGFPLDRALQFMAEQTTKTGLAELLEALSLNVRQGMSLTDALAQHPKAFDGLYRAMVAAGEMGGQLTTLLDRLATMRERTRAFRRQIISSLTYPAIMVFVMFASLAILMVFVVPRFTAMFADMGTTLPSSTMILAQLSTFLGNYWWLLAGLTVGIGIGIAQLRKSEEGRKRSDAWLLKLPLTGAVVLRMGLSRFCLTLATLLKSGVPMEKALACVRGVAGNIILTEAIAQAAEAVKRGVSLGDALADTQVFPDDLVEIVRVGEHSGQLDVLLERTGASMEEKVRNLIQGLLNGLEPAMILFMGLVIGFIVMAMMMPIFNMDIGAGG